MSQATSSPLLRIAEVCKSTCYGRTSIYTLMRTGDFPCAVKLPGGGSRWWEHEINAAWKASLPRATRNTPMRGG